MATPRREAKKERERAARAIRLAAAKRKSRMRVIAVTATFGLIALTLGFNSLSNSGNTKKTDTTLLPTTSLVPTATTTQMPALINAECPNANGSSQRAINFDRQLKMCIDQKKTYYADFDTTEGKIIVKLDQSKAKNGVNNFVFLSRYHYFDNTKIFRTNTGIDIFQGGSPHTQTNSDQGPGYTLEDEGLPAKYEEGDLVYANSGANTSSGQWFFGTGSNVLLLDKQGSYVKFGKATEGIDVLHNIMKLHKAGSDPTEGAPSKDVVVKTVTIREG